ncbi:MAG: hypothetical protein B7Z59_06010 [Acidiphilium sp. 37-67-22]|nr:MAG: hypothetical protein B7Z59_06010 [Acidiphilium sp. 37-67-22]HQT73578.1 hypothetical protein [Acidiphilium sp.]
MVNIYTKRDGPRPEDARIRKVLQENRATITRIADHITAGGYSARKAPKPAPQARGLIISTGGASRPEAEAAAPAVRISVNGRVCIVDGNSGYQLHHVGNVVRRGGEEVFVLASAANGFIAPAAPEIVESLADLDGMRLDPEQGEDELAGEVGVRLGIE